MKGSSIEAAASGRPPRRGFGRGAYLALFLGPAALYALVFMVLPYVNVLRYSVWYVDSYVVVEELTLANYQRIYENQLYLTVIGNSLQIAAIVTASAVVLGFLLAFYVAFYSGRWRTTLFFLIVIPLWTSFLLRAFIWRIILGREGIINGSLVHLGLVDEPLSLLLFNKFSICVALTYVFIPFVALPVYAALEKIPKEVLEASLDLGARPLETLWRVIVPLSLPGVVTGAVFTFCLSFGDFVAPSLLGGPSDIMISGVIINQFGSAFDWPMGSALAVVVIAVVAFGVWVAMLAGRRHA